MGRGSLLLAGMTAASLMTGLVGLGGCQAMYGGKPERLGNPAKKKRPPEKPDEGNETKYVDDCAADFRGDPARVSRQLQMSNQLLGEGEVAMGSAEKAKDPTSQAEFIKLSISKFSNSLQKDPYNHDATLALAIAYDKVNRKGCALLLLKRLAQLETNPKFGRGAKAAADRVTDTPQWFRGYRKDAISALGR